VPSVVHTEIEINASASRVWAILTDFERYYEWNPFITEAKGELRRGNRLTLTLEPPDQLPMKIEPKVLECTALGTIAMECTDTSDHQIVLDPMASGVRVTHLQRYDETLDERYVVLADRIRLGLEMMNAALKARAER
jgi:hypothetical protein